MKQLAVIAMCLTLFGLPLVAAAEAEQRIREKLNESRPDLAVESVEASDIPGMYVVQFADGPQVYATADGRYMFVGDAYELRPGAGLVNVRERRQEGPRAQALAAVDPATTINFGPEGEVAAVVYVFTDVDCGYCQVLHREMAQLNAMGIEVRYLAYPRAGAGSDTYRKMASAWCAPDRQQAMDRLKARQSIPENVCRGNPVMAQYELARSLGVQGTPAIVAENGQIIPGYMPAERLARVLGIAPDAAAAR